MCNVPESSGDPGTSTACWASLRGLISADQEVIPALDVKQVTANQSDHTIAALEFLKAYGANAVVAIKCDVGFNSRLNRWRSIGVAQVAKVNDVASAGATAVRASEASLLHFLLDHPKLIHVGVLLPIHC